MKARTAFVNADYTELQPRTYQGCYFNFLNCDGATATRFKTGCYADDVKLALEDAVANGATSVYYCSSIDHYIQDSNKN